VAPHRSSGPEIVHCVPGRLRLRLEGMRHRDRDEVLSAVQKMEADPRIDQVRGDRRTDSALITWDPSALDIDGAVALLRSAHEALSDVTPPAASRQLERNFSTVAAGVSVAFARADSSVREATRGTLDLRMLVPLALAGLSVRQLVRTGPRIASMPWYGLAYYAFDSFHKLHSHALPGLGAVAVREGSGGRL
jgi:hypothetical protein